MAWMLIENQPTLVKNQTKTNKQKTNKKKTYTSNMWIQFQGGDHSDDGGV